MAIIRNDGVDNEAFDKSRQSIDNSVAEQKFENDEGNSGLGLSNTEAEMNEVSRDTWGSGLEFLFSCIAMSVGLGNIWRFPFAAYENGGGAFLIPYIITLLLIGRPVYYLEMCLGQFSSRANVKTFEALAPALKGIGYGQTVGSFCVATYYCSLMCLSLFYFLNSFTSNLPWATCREEWNLENITCLASQQSYNLSDLSNAKSSSELYFKMEVLHQSDDIFDGIGYPDWRLTLCLVGSWIATFAVSINGVQSSGKASYFLALFPYVIMIALLIKASTLEGAANGMLYFISPNWSKLMEAKVWYSAVTQCFFSLNIGFGSLTMYASYNDFRHNIYKDAIVVSFLDTFTSILAGTTIFGILGNLAHKQKVDVGAVINAGGTGLAFVSYPEAIAKFDSIPWLFSLLFFLMLFVLSVGCLIALQGTLFAAIMDHFPHLKKWHVSLGCAFLGFLIGLIYVTPGGQFMVTLIDYFSGSFIFFILATFEIVALAWWYGLENFCDDIEFMLKRRVGMYFRVTWGLFTPIVLIGIFIYFMGNIERLKHEGIDYPDYVLGLGWMVLGFALFQTVFWWSYYVFHKRRLGFYKCHVKFGIRKSHGKE